MPYTVSYTVSTYPRDITEMKPTTKLVGECPSDIATNKWYVEYDQEMLYKKIVGDILDMWNRHTVEDVLAI